MIRFHTESCPLQLSNLTKRAYIMNLNNHFKFQRHAFKLIHKASSLRLETSLKNGHNFLVNPSMSLYDLKSYSINGVLIGESIRKL